MTEQDDAESCSICIYDLEVVTTASWVTPKSISRGLWFWSCRHGCTGWKGHLWERVAGLSQMCWQHGALARLVKVAPEQIISTSNLNILKSKNNIESCWLYCKVLLH